ncbi:MAG TPA: hypothetical protein VES67_14575 [Vicinamibacterales bacterium]|nr:hypothetical protein [Vicinamibacterales bacterium]
MLKGNLSTRPFYNEKVVSLALGGILLVAVGLTVFNVIQLVSLSRERRVLNSHIERDRAEAARISAQADAIQRTVDRSRLQLLAGGTREANALIDQRTFSWTEFFGLIEKTLPRDVRLIGVTPRVEQGEFKIAMRLMARTPDDVAKFSDSLTGTGYFYDVIPMETQRNDDDTDTLTLVAGYLPPVNPNPGRKGGPTPPGKRGERP